MFETKQQPSGMRWNLSLTLMAMGVTLIVLVGAAGAQESEQKTFATQKEASTALYDAAKSGDKAGTLAVLGASASPIISSGDSVIDNKNVASFIRRYDEMNRWGKEINGDQTLFLGAENWPFPIPLKKDAAGQWFYDTKAGLEEILYRRIGNNEYAAIRVSGVLADAQIDYYSGLHDGDAVHQYAQRFLSEPGKQNGLYWKAAEGESESPIGPLIAYATGEGYEDKAQSFHGYFYRILKSQGAQSPGGAKDYVAKGKMTGGFAFLGYPAEYRNSGVMTFVVDAKGRIYEKDLGPTTVDQAKTMAAINLDSTWKRVSAEAEDDAQAVNEK